MMKFNFYKYQGTGNDFVMLDNREGLYNALSNEQIQQISHRKFGIGCDGVILVMPHATHDFEMRYYNADGSRSFCGNGARAAVRFAEFLGLAKGECSFLAIDGVHTAKIFPNEIALAMSPVNKVEEIDGNYVCNTGSPHFIKFTEDDIQSVDIVEYGKSIRFNDTYKKEGINVNVANASTLDMLTYERGVEDETLSCGTGATAVALAYAKKFDIEGKLALNLQVKGGLLQVAFERSGEEYTNIQLIGPAVEVFRGEYEL